MRHSVVKSLFTEQNVIDFSLNRSFY